MDQYKIRMHTILIIRITHQIDLLRIEEAVEWGIFIKCESFAEVDGGIKLIHRVLQGPVE